MSLFPSKQMPIDQTCKKKNIPLFRITMETKTHHIPIQSQSVKEQNKQITYGYYASENVAVTTLNSHFNEKIVVNHKTIT